MFCSLEYQYELRWVQQQAWPVQTPCGWSCVHQATPAEGRGLCKSAAWAKPAGGRTSPDWRSPPPAALICCDAAWTSPPVADQSSTTERSLKADQLHFHFIVLRQSCVPFYKYKYIFLKLTVAVYHVLYSTLSSPVYPRSVQISLCRFCLSPLLLCLIPIPRRTLPPPASGLYVWCSPAARDLSSADAASSSPLASPYAAHGRHQRKCCTVIPAGRGSSAAPVVTQRGSSCSEAMVTHKKKNLYS